MTRKIEQVSFLDHSQLIGTARYGAPVSAAHIAKLYRTIPERSYDELDYYDFLGLRVDGVLLGFRTRFRSSPGFSVISVLPDAFPGGVGLISEVCRVDRLEVETFDETW